jgi:hypothetical protein
MKLKNIFTGALLSASLFTCGVQASTTDLSIAVITQAAMDCVESGYIVPRKISPELYVEYLENEKIKAFNKLTGEERYEFFYYRDSIKHNLRSECSYLFHTLSKDHPEAKQLFWFIDNPSNI